MFEFKDKKSRICLWGMLISVVILVIVFFSTDGLLGDKEFSEYTREDWSIAAVPLLIMAVSLIATLVFAFMIIIPMIWLYPALLNYMISEKFSDINTETDFLAFDHNEFKRACCRYEGQDGLWISIKEYSLKKRKWSVLEEGRYIEHSEELSSVLRKDYGYDCVKFYYSIPGQGC